MTAPAPPPRVLVVDDLPEARLAVKMGLEREGLVVEQAGDGATALARVAARRPDLVVLDVGMPGMSGLEVMSRLRRHDAALPVILLTAHAGEAERVLGLELGADDYVAKPFSSRELAARSRSVLRRARRWQQAREIVAGPLRILPAERKLLLHGRPVDAPPKEFDLLAFLASAPAARVFSREELLREVWGSSAQWQDPSTVTEHIRRLRKRIEVDANQPELLQTVRGVGYRFDPGAAEEPATATGTASATPA